MIHAASWPTSRAAGAAARRPDQRRPSQPSVSHALTAMLAAIRPAWATAEHSDSISVSAA